MSSLKNDFARFTIVNLDPDSPSRGPFIVAQNGSSPNDPKLIAKIYLLAKDGSWVDWSALFGSQHAMADDLLFDTVQEVVKTIEALNGPVRVRALESDPKAGIEKIEMIQAGGGLRVAIRHLLEQRKHNRD